MRRPLTVLTVVLLAAVFAHEAHAAGAPVVYIENLSQAVPHADVDAALPAFQLAVSRDLAPTWGTDAVLTTDPAYEAGAAMVMEIRDDADCFGCLGYHNVIHGRPTSRVFAGTSAAVGESWQLIFTHELFEMLVDPWINRMSVWKKRTWLVEVSDPCESGKFAYFIDGVAISDFITPRWYNRSLPGPFDFTRRFERPGQIGRHGYASYLDPASFDGWSQVLG